MTQPQAEHARRVVGYYRTPESRLAYRPLLGGTKHFGYYPEGAGRLSTAAAMRRMEDKLGETLALPPGSRVLDAGCGEGDVPIRLRTCFGLEVDGVDLLEPSLRRARAKAARLGLSDSLRFHRLDYGDLAFGDQRFDGAYTMETLVPAFVHGALPAILAGCCGPGRRCSTARPWSRAIATGRAGATTSSGPARRGRLTAAGGRDDPGRALVRPGRCFP